MPSQTSRRPILAVLTGFAFTGLALSATATGALAQTAQDQTAAPQAPQAQAQATLPMPQSPALPDVASYVLMDARTGDIIASKAPDMARPPASLTKLMTAYLAYQALATGRLKPDDQIPVSTAAWKAGGSRMFLEPGKPVTVDQLLHGLIIQSGNDSAIALAEAIGGTQQSFVQAMNAQAARLGLKDTHYANVDGLPATGLQTSAQDVALLSRALILTYPQILQISAQKSYSYNKISQRSWNPVLFKDPTVDGLKTGLTDAAGHCIAATAVRDGRRLIAVEMGAPGWDAGTDDIETLLNYGYRFFTNATIATAGQPVAQVTDPRMEPQKILVGTAKSLTMSIPDVDKGKVQPVLKLAGNLPEKMPKGTVVGTIEYQANGTTLARLPAVTLTDTQPAGLITRMMRKIHSGL